MPDQRSNQAPVDGLLLLNKPAGLTSNKALQIVKRLLKARKAGHTGSLDPAATGMLPLCFGEATKVCAYLLDADKTYRVTARLGESTDTGDRDGVIVNSAAVPEMDRAAWSQMLGRFVGKTVQIPPMYSALRKDGKRLYELARKGEIVDREPRPITVRKIDLLEIHGSRLVFRVCCSKGTYIRTLVEDIAEAAGTIAYTASLHRESVGSFPSDGMIDLTGARKLAKKGPDGLHSRLIPTDQALIGWTDCEISNADAERFSGGQVVATAIVDGGRVRVYAADGRFLGVGEATGDGRVAPKRIFRLAG